MNALRLTCILVLFSTVYASISTVASAKEGRPPNILFILTDDQGWASLSCYGSPHVPTPNLDGLAAQGMRFTDAYVMPQCTPTRAALLTGEHTARNRMWHVIGWYGYPWARMTEPAFRENLLPEACRLPHALRQAGYITGMGGKWHLTTNTHGQYTHLNQASGELFGFDYVAPPGTGSQNEGDKWVDHLTDSAAEFIERNREKPWFFYLSHHTLHGRVSAPAALIDKQLAAGAAEVGLQNATYLAAIEHLDNSIGRLLRKLDELHLRDNTIVVFLSDNGGVDTQCVHPESSDTIVSGQEARSLESKSSRTLPCERERVQFMRAVSVSPVSFAGRTRCELIRFARLLFTSSTGCRPCFLRQPRHSMIRLMELI